VWQEPAEWLGSPAAARYPLHLISNQPHTKLHSQYDHGAVSLASKIQGREPIAMHPGDAAARGLEAGDIVRVFNGRGACLAGLRIEEGLRPGVVEMATGAWYDPLEPGRIGTLDKHGNPNVLTLDKGSSRLGQGCMRTAAWSRSSVTRASCRRSPRTTRRGLCSEAEKLSPLPMRRSGARTGIFFCSAARIFTVADDLPGRHSPARRFLL
jgi:hypothetical protein